MATIGAASDILVGLPKNLAAPCVITPPSLKVPLCSSADNRAVAVDARRGAAPAGVAKLGNEPYVIRAADKTAPAPPSHRDRAERPAALLRIFPS